MIHEQVRIISWGKDKIAFVDMLHILIELEVSKKEGQSVFTPELRAKIKFRQVIVQKERGARMIQNVFRNKLHKEQSEGAKYNQGPGGVNLSEASSLSSTPTSASAPSTPVILSDLERQLETAGKPNEVTII